MKLYANLFSVRNRMMRVVSNIAGEKILIEAIEEADRLEEE